MTCQGFAAGELLVVTWDVQSGTKLLEVNADANGAASFTVKFPETTSGAHKLIVVGQTSRQRVDMAVKVKASISLSPKTGGQGSSFTIKLKGFEKAEIVDIKWYVDSSKTTTIKRGVAVSDSGSATVTVKVPTAATSGKHKVEAVGRGSSKVGTTFTVVVTTSSLSGPKVEPTSTPRPPRATATPEQKEVPATATSVPTEAPPPAETPVADQSQEDQ